MARLLPCTCQLSTAAPDSQCCCGADHQDQGSRRAAAGHRRHERVGLHANIVDRVGVWRCEGAAKSALLGAALSRTSSQLSSARLQNPYGLDQSTGGSSGGPAAATAANLGMICFGSDTGRHELCRLLVCGSQADSPRSVGSSIRTPSAFQSLTGIRVTTGLISRRVLPVLALCEAVKSPGTTRLLQQASSVVRVPA